MNTKYLTKNSIIRMNYIKNIEIKPFIINENLKTIYEYLKIKYNEDVKYNVLNNYNYKGIEQWLYENDMHNKIINSKMYIINDLKIIIYNGELTKEFIKLINIVNELFKILTKIEKKIEIHYYRNNKKRIYKGNFDNRKKEAFTISGQCFDNKIYVTRKEEIIKLIIHELIHCYNLDRRNNKFYEAIAEYYGSLINSMLISIRTNIELQQILDIEKRYSKYIVYKIEGLEDKNLKKHLKYNYPYKYYYVYKMYFYNNNLDIFSKIRINKMKIKKIIDDNINYNLSCLELDV